MIYFQQRTSSIDEPHKKTKLSISLDEKLGDFNLINSQNPASIPKSFETENEPHTFMDSDDFDNIPIGSPFLDRSFSFPDDYEYSNRSKIVSLKRRVENENEEIEKRNHNEIQEVLRRSKLNLAEDIEEPKPVRPSDFGPVSIVDHTVMEVSGIFKENNLMPIFENYYSLSGREKSGQNFQSRVCWRLSSRKDLFSSQILS